MLCAPIRFGGRQLGILYVDSRRVGSLLSERDLGLLSAFAALAGSALENARLIDELRRKNELLAQMAHQAGAVKLALARVDLAQVAGAALAGVKALAAAFRWKFARSPLPFFTRPALRSAVWERHFYLAA